MLQRYLNTISDVEKTPEGYMKGGKILFLPHNYMISINAKIIETLTVKIGMDFMESKDFMTGFINDTLGTSYLADDLFISITLD